MRLLLLSFFALLCATPARAGDAAMIRRYRGLTASTDATRFSLRGVWWIAVAPDGVTFTARLLLGNTAFAVIGVFDENGVARFGRNASATIALKRAGRSDLTLQFSRSTAVPPQLTGTVTEADTGAVANLTAAPALYVATANPPAPYLQTPSELRGRYTVIFPPKSAAEQSLAPESYPQGYGVGRLIVTADGQAALAGRLADGSIVSWAGPITAGNTWVFWTLLYGGGGGILGMVEFRDQPGVSDFDGASLRWFKPAVEDGVRYGAGWPGGIQVDVLGSKYVVPSLAEARSVFPGLAPSTPQGNAHFTLTQGGLGGTDLLVKAVNIGPRNGVQILRPGVERFSAKLLPASGLLRGSFLHPATGTAAYYLGAIFQKQSRAYGFFLSPPLEEE